MAPTGTQRTTRSEFSTASLALPKTSSKIPKEIAFSCVSTDLECPTILPTRFPRRIAWAIEDAINPNPIKVTLL
jgi:hypothetical protein